MPFQVETEEDNGYVTTEKLVEALDAGVEVDDIKNHFVNTLNVNQEDVDNALAEAEQIRAGAQQAPETPEVPAETPSYEQPVIDQQVQVEPEPKFFYGQDKPLGDPTADVEKMDTSELLATIEGYKRQNLDFATLLRGGWSDATQAKVAEDIATLKRAQVDIARDNGIPLVYDAETNSVGQMTADGRFEQMDSGFLDQLYADKLEAVGSVAGGWRGAIWGASRAPTFPHPVATGISKAGGAILGAAGWGGIGAGTGRGADIIAAADALDTIDKLEFQEVMGQMAQAGMDDATFTAIIGPVADTAFKSIGTAWRFIAKGNIDGATKAMDEALGLDKTQKAEILEKFEELTGKTKGHKSQAEREIEAVALTVPGAEQFTAPALALDPTAGARVTKLINDRAQDVLTKTRTLTSDNVVTVVKDDLKKYTDLVKANFGNVRQAAIDSVPRDYSFDYKKLAVDPLLDKIESSITNPNVLESFKLQVAKARLLGTTATKQVTTETGEVIEKQVMPGVLDATGERIYPENVSVMLDENLRSFENLLELRQTVNNFKFNKKLGSVVNSDAIDSVLKKIDKEVSNTVNKHMADPKGWKNAWRKQNTEYAKMKALEENAIYKALTTKGVEPDKMVKLFANKIDSPDGIFQDVMKRLPKSTQAKMEGSVIDHLANQYTAGIEGGMRATHFPMLAKKMESVAFHSPDARAFKRVVRDMAEVWRNDVTLAQVSGNITIPKFQSYLTTDPIVRAKFEIASSVFNFVKRLIPNEKSRAIALVTKTGKVLENPRNAKALKAIEKELGEDLELRDAVNRAQITLAKYGESDITEPAVKIYRAIGKDATDPNKGFYFSSQSGAKDEVSHMTGEYKVIQHTVHPHRIADRAKLSRLLGVSENSVTFDFLRQDDIADKLPKLLKDEGFLGYNIGEKFELFK